MSLKERYVNSTRLAVKNNVIDFDDIVFPQERMEFKDSKNRRADDNYHLCRPAQENFISIKSLNSPWMPIGSQKAHIVSEGLI